MPTGVWPVAAVVGEFMVKLALIGYILLRRPARPASNLAWITVILAIPVLGVIAYLFVGEVRLSRRRIDRHAEIRTRLQRGAPVHRAERPAVDDRFHSIATLAEAVGDNVPVAGNTLELIGETTLFIDALVSDIDAARSHCHLVFYIFLDDHSGRRVADALRRAAARGIECRLLVDAVGSRPFARSALRTDIERSGVRVVEALPTNTLRMLLARLDLRNHRKIAIIDGVVGYLGSHNIADAEFAIKPKYAPWIDAMVRVRGPVLRDLSTIVAEDWFMDTDETLASAVGTDVPADPDGVVAQVMATGPNAYNDALRQLILTAFHTAQEELILTTPYFVPDTATATALRTAARRGVETILIVPARNDSPLVAAASRSHYESMLEAGVRIFEFHAGLLHAKTMTLDRTLAVITTANVDRRSFELNFEVSMVVYDTDFASQLRFLQKSYLSRAHDIDVARWRRRPATTRMWQSAAGTLSPLL